MGLTTVFCSKAVFGGMKGVTRSRIWARKSFLGRSTVLGSQNGSRCRAFFNFNKNNSADALPTLSRSDFSTQEVEDYFNYMGMLAAEGNYDRLEAMLASGLEPVDLLLLMACSENDTPKVEELLKAGADTSVKDLNGRTPLELCKKEEIREMLEVAMAKN